MVDSVLEVQNIKTTGISPQKDIVTTDSGTGDVTVKGNVVVPDGGTIGSAGDTDAITIDSSGSVGIGTSSHYDATTKLTAAGRINTSNGTLTGTMNYGNGTVMNLGTISAHPVQLMTENTTRIYLDTSGARPGAHNTYDLGTSSYYWNDGYIYNGVTTGSDGRQKQDIEELSEAEQRVAFACKGLLRKFRWKDMVAEKGDDARIHFGIIAQDLKAAFEAEGLDAGRYGMFIHSEWWEAYTEVPAVEAQEAYTRTDIYNTEEEAPEGAVKKDRMGIRYSELLAFIIAAI